jgi:hypothetical protein
MENRPVEMTRYRLASLANYYYVGIDVMAVSLGSLESSCFHGVLILQLFPVAGHWLVDGMRTVGVIHRTIPP